MSASVSMEVVIITAITRMEIIHVPVMMATKLAVMDTPVMVGIFVVEKLLTKYNTQNMESQL